MCIAGMAAYLGLAVLGIKGVFYVLDTPARNAAKHAAQHQFEHYRFYLDKAVLAGDLAAVENAIASPDATVLDRAVRGSDIELRIAVGATVHHGGGLFGTTGASAFGCAEMSAHLGAQPAWRAVPCPKNVAAHIKLARPIYKVTLSMTR